MNAPFPLNPETGQWSGNWVWNGARWVSASTDGLRVLTHSFTASGPYMPTPGLVSCVVECVGGGGGGGSAGPTPGVQWVLAGGGGGSGGYSRSTLPAALVRGGVLVTVGQGGLWGGAGQYQGGTGGTTSFGALCVANGGHGGAGMNLNDNFGDGGAGGAAGVGDVTFPGAAGQTGQWQQTATTVNASVQGGVAGAIFGGGQITHAAPGGGGSGEQGIDNSGAGGSGAVINQLGNQEEVVGGLGGSGICIVTEYVVGDRDQPTVEWRPPLDVNVNVRPPKPGPGWWPPGPWPPGWPPGWGPGGWPPGPPWPPGWGPGPWPRGTLPQGREFEAGVETFGDDPPEDDS